MYLNEQNFWGNLWQVVTEFWFFQGCHQQELGATAALQKHLILCWRTFKVFLQEIWQNYIQRCIVCRFRPTVGSFNLVGRLLAPPLAPSSYAKLER